MGRILTVLVLSFLSIFSAQSATTSLPPVPDRGLYALTMGNGYLNLPYVAGGRVLLQWADLETAEGVYNWSEVDSNLYSAFSKGKKFTLQINGGNKPAWLYQKVAVLPGTFNQVNDPQGALQYWDPIYINAYKNFIVAFAQHLRQSPYKSALLGVRQNFNAIGTELGWLYGDQINLANWVPAPNGHKYEVEWTSQIYTDYRREIISAHIDAFRPDICLFIRNNVFYDDILTPVQVDMVDRGELALFHTSSEHQPRVYSEYSNEDFKFILFQQYCLSGKTTGYTEPWNPSTTNDWGIEPLQYNYWRLLLDLNCGISFISLKYTDLDLRTNAEFNDAFIFAAKYAGYHASPRVSPGGWVGLREGESLKGDYNFLMRRLQDVSTDTPLALQGPTSQRYGLWARSISGGNSMVFQMDRSLASSLASAQIRIVYLDEGTNSFTLAWDEGGATRQQTVQKQNTGQWQEYVVEVPMARFTSALNGGDIMLTGTGTNIFHMVEVLRTGTTEAKSWQQYN